MRKRKAAAIKISRKLARKLARMAAAAGQPLQEFVERALRLATTEETPRDVFISFNFDERAEHNRFLTAYFKVLGEPWTLGKD